MAEILQIIRALGLYALTLAIALPNLWVLTRMLRTGRLPYARRLEIFTLGLLVCLPVFYLNTWLLGLSDEWIRQWFYLPRGDSVARVWLTNLFVVAPVEEGFKALAFAAALWRLRQTAPQHTQSAAAPVFWAALLAAGFASFENVLYALNAEAARNTGFAVIGLRAVTSSLVHCAATSMLGLAIGLRRRYRLPGWLSVFAGFSAALLIHAGYNVLAQLELPGAGGGFHGQGRFLVQASAAVVVSSLPPLLAYALGLIEPLPAAAPAAGAASTAEKATDPAPEDGPAA